MQALAVTPRRRAATVSAPMPRAARQAEPQRRRHRAPATPENAREQQHLAAQPRAAPHLQRAIGVNRPAQVQRRGAERQAADQQRRRAPRCRAASTRRTAAAARSSRTRRPTAASAPSSRRAASADARASTCVMSQRPRVGRQVSGSVMRVVDRLPSSTGQAGVAGLRRRTDARHVGDVDDLDRDGAFRAGADARRAPGRCARRPWHMSHLPTTPRSGLYCGTPYEQFHVQY